MRTLFYLIGMIGMLSDSGNLNTQAPTNLQIRCQDAWPPEESHFEDPTNNYNLIQTNRILICGEDKNRQITPPPASDLIVFTNLLGSVVFIDQVSGHEISLKTGSWPSGVYIIRYLSRST